MNDPEGVVVGREDVIDVICCLAGAFLVFGADRLERDHLLTSHERTDQRGHHALHCFHRVTAYDRTQPVAAVPVIGEVFAAVVSKRLTAVLAWLVVLELDAGIPPRDHDVSKVPRRVSHYS